MVKRTKYLAPQMVKELIAAQRDINNYGWLVYTHGYLYFKWGKKDQLYRIKEEHARLVNSLTEINNIYNAPFELKGSRDLRVIHIVHMMNGVEFISRETIMTSKFTDDSKTEIEFTMRSGLRLSLEELATKHSYIKYFLKKQTK
ncbi:hypothetical protein EMN46_12440 [Ancylomarina sp. 16SWW S1-10-2]|nr:hypothetical protein [Ancylomarina sp. 16SWW S1-10-2]